MKKKHNTIKFLFLLVWVIETSLVYTVATSSPSESKASNQVRSPKKNGYREKSPFKVCDSIVTAVVPEEYSHDHLKGLKFIKAEFKKKYVMDNEKINKIFAQLNAVNSKSEIYQTMLEDLTNSLNSISGKDIVHTKKSKAYSEIRKMFLSPKLRAPTGIGRNDDCIRDHSKIFDEFSIGLRMAIKLFFRNSDFSKKLVTKMNRVGFYPSGSRAFFGAITTRKYGKPSICINPEEETTLLLPKILHELSHANNDKIGRLGKKYEKQRKKWIAARKKHLAASDKISEFDSFISEDSDIDSENILDLIEDLEDSSLGRVIDLLRVTARSQKPYKNIATEKGFRIHAKPLIGWKKTLKTKEEERIKAVAFRQELDKERFYDEHVAYSYSLKAAYALVEDSPNYFCNIWVPSFQRKQPVRFYQAYQMLEERIYKGTFSSWLADTYTFKSQNFLKISLYGKNSREEGAKNEFLSEGKRILIKELNILSDFDKTIPATFIDLPKKKSSPKNSAPIEENN